MSFSLLDGIGASHLTNTGSVESYYGHTGLCAKFNGSNYLSVVDNPALSVNDESFYVDFWLKTSDPSGIQCVMSKWNYGPSTSRLFCIYFGIITNNHLEFRVVDDVGYDIVVSSTVDWSTLNLAQWHHVRAGYNKALQQIYITVDSTTDTGSYIYTISDEGNPFRIGADQAGTYIKYNTLIDDITFSKSDVDVASWSFGTEPSPTFLSGYTKRKRITISNGNVISDLTNFPMMVKITSDSDIGASARSDGYDIRFTSSDGTTLLDYERELFSITSGSASGTFWVCVPTIASATTTDIYIYFGKSDASSDTSTISFWDADYSNIYHFGEAGSGLNDSSNNGNHLTNNGLVISGGKASLSGDDYATASFESNLSPSTTRMLSALASTSGGTGRRCILSFSFNYDNFETNLGHRWNGNDTVFSAEVCKAGTASSGVDSDITVVTNEVYHIANVYKENDEVDLYINGEYNCSANYADFIKGVNKVWNWTYPAVLTDGTDYVTFTWGVNSTTHYFGITNFDTNLDELFGAGNWSKTDVYPGGSGASGGSWDITLIGTLAKSAQDTPAVTGEVVTGGGNNTVTEITAGIAPATQISSPSNDLLVGAEIYGGYPDFFFLGEIYEARYSLTARSNAWIKFEAKNLVNGEITFAALESSGGSTSTLFPQKRILICA